MSQQGRDRQVEKAGAFPMRKERHQPASYSVEAVPPIDQNRRVRYRVDGPGFKDVTYGRLTEARCAIAELCTKQSLAPEAFKITIQLC